MAKLVANNRAVFMIMIRYSGTEEVILIKLVECAETVVNKAVCTTEEARVMDYGVGVMQDHHVVEMKEQLKLKEGRDTEVHSTKNDKVYWNFLPTNPTLRHN
jgi:hypothetical protein